MNNEDGSYRGDNPVHWNSAMGSETASRLGGAGGFISAGSTVFGMNNTTGLVNGRLAADGTFHQEVNGRNVMTTCLTGMAGAASGVAAFSQIAGPYGAVAGAALGVIGQAINGGLAAFDTHRTIAALKNTRSKIPVWIDEGSDMAVVGTVIDFCLGKMQTRFIKSAATAAVVGQPLVPLYKAGRAIQKTVMHAKGKDRAINARDLVAISQKEGPAAGLAREVIGALFARKYEQIMVDTVADAMKSG
jgi:hypothetical protein